MKWEHMIAFSLKQQEYRFSLYPNSLLIMLLWKNMQLMEMYGLLVELQAIRPRAMGTLGFFLDSDSSCHTGIVLSVHSRCLCPPLLCTASLNLGQKLHTHQRLQLSFIFINSEGSYPASTP